VTAMQEPYVCLLCGQVYDNLHDDKHYCDQCIPPDQMKNLDYPVLCMFCHRFLFDNNKGTFYCEHCAEENQLSSVIMTYQHDQDQPLYAHMYTGYGEKDFHIRLHLRENFTLINDPVIKVPGFPLNPKNIKEKLKLYMTFS
jgi:hypothetical protein